MEKALAFTLLIGFFAGGLMTWIVTNFRGEQQTVGIIFALMIILVLIYGVWKAI